MAPQLFGTEYILYIIITTVLSCVALLPGTPLTAWVMAPMYALGHGLVLLGVEIWKRAAQKVRV